MLCKARATATLPWSICSTEVTLSANHSTPALASVCIACALATSSGCRIENPAFHRSHQQLQDSSASNSTSTTQEPEPLAPAQQHAGTEDTDSTTATIASVSSSSSQDSLESSTQPEIQEDPYCDDAFAACFSMSSNPESNDSQAVTLSLGNTKLLDRDPNRPPPWDRLLRVEPHDAIANTPKTIAIGSDQTLGLEVAAEDLSCKKDGERCPIVAINGYVSINYRNDGLVQCEARTKRTVFPAVANIITLDHQLGASLKQVRALCWSDGKSVMFWANGHFKSNTIAGGFLPTTEPTDILVGGDFPITGGLTSIQGSVALIRLWSDVAGLKEKLDAKPEL